MNLLIVKDHHHKWTNLNQFTICNIGQMPDDDIYFKGLESKVSITILSQDILVSIYQDIKCIKNFKFSKKKTRHFQYENIDFFFTPAHLQINEESSDWANLPVPGSEENANYPNQILNFLLKLFHLPAAAIYYRDGNQLELLAEENVHLSPTAFDVFKNFVENSSEDLIKVNFDTHSLLFKTDQDLRTFLLLKSPLSKSREVLIYIPDHSQNFKAGQMRVLLHLIAGKIANFILQRELKTQASPYQESFLWGNSKIMLNLKEMVTKVAPTSLNILIQGETGTGKEELAKFIHQIYQQSIGKAPLVTINCATIPENLAESLLFGHEKGAFTGADKSSKGFIAEANGGVLFLDEIAELPMTVQAKLLRVLQEKTLRPLGSTQEIKVDFRLIAATHKNLTHLIEQGKFREDLYFRINDFTLTLAPLRSRPEDIEYLAKKLLTKICLNNQMKQQKILSFSSLSHLKSMEFKGNIRELLSILRRAVFLSSSDVIEPSDFSSNNSVTTENQFKDLKTARDEYTRAYIQKAILACGKDRQKASELLGISQRTLFRLIANTGTDDDKNVSQVSVTH